MSYLPCCLFCKILPHPKIEQQAQELVRESNEVSGLHGEVNKFRIDE